MAGCQIESVYTGISGNHVCSIDSQGMIAIKVNGRKVSAVSEEDVERVLDQAKAVKVPDDQIVLHVLPQRFTIDGQSGVKRPVGMAGVRLEVQVHMVTCAKNAYQNIENCIRECGLQVQEMILEHLASSHAVLTSDERELGVCLIDIGAGTTDIAVFIDDEIRFTEVIPIAGDQVTNDIAKALRIPTQHAEKLKLEHACAFPQLVSDGDPIPIDSAADGRPRNLSRQTLAEVVELRCEELFLLVHDVLSRSGYQELLGAGIVLTGGSSVMQGIRELAESVFHLPVRIGVPQGVKGLGDTVNSPVYATGVGLLRYGFSRHGEAEEEWRRPGGGSWVRRMVRWMRNSF